MGMTRKTITYDEVTASYLHSELYGDNWVKYAEHTREVTEGLLRDCHHFKFQYPYQCSTQFASDIRDYYSEELSGTYYCEELED